MATPGETRGRPPKVRPQSVNTDPTVELEHQRAIAQRLTELRTRLGWTPGDLAARAGLTPEAMRALERGETTPTWTIQAAGRGAALPGGVVGIGGVTGPLASMTTSIAASETRQRYLALLTQTRFAAYYPAT